MKPEDVVAQINEVMVQGFEIAPELLKPDARLMEDLGLDSLDGVDLVVAIEKKMGCRVDESTARSMRTMKNIYDYVERVLPATVPPA